MSHRWVNQAGRGWRYQAAAHWVNGFGGSAFVLYVAEFAMTVAPVPLASAAMSPITTSLAMTTAPVPMVRAIQIQAVEPSE